ncbi:DUF929 domain-containing protein [Candidatus Marsarchaeota archaeon]|nr:DUF929 domain-containing protein [Candidatus Marsarchaeota archaeon]
MKINKKFSYIIIFTLIIIGIALVLFIKFNSHSNLVLYDNNPVSKSFASQLYNISNNETMASQLGFGNTSAFPINEKSIPKLVINGSNKPNIIYIGSEACPFCGITRWSLIIALMRFGNFTNLHYMTSNSTDVYPNTPTFTFYNSTYSSKLVNFVSVEEQTNTYKSLQTPTKQEITIYEKLDLNNSLVPSYARGGVPFIDFGNLSVLVGAMDNPELVHNQNWSVILSELRNPRSVQGQAIIGVANIFTAEICAISNNTPGICNETYVKTIQKNLNIAT